MNKSKRIFFSIIFVLVAIFCFTACDPSMVFMTWPSPSASSETNEGVFQTVVYRSSNVLEGTATGSVADVIEAIRDCVVEINCTLPNGTAAGSGVIYGHSEVGEKIYIVTNHHVIENASEVKIILRTGKTYEATVLASDTQGDVAILSVDPAEGETHEDFVYATLPEENYSARVGDVAIAIGNPLGALGGTVTQGIVSALDRFITVDDTLMLLMQTDASINSGNSGGGLFNRAGELIGIVNAKATGTNVEGLGFAIPIKAAMEIVSQLTEKGYVSRGAIGVTIATLSSNSQMQSFLQQYISYNTWGKIIYKDIEAYNFWYDIFTDERIEDYRYGIYITEISSSDPNTQASLQVGDYIISVDGQRITDNASRQRALYGKQAGDVVSISVYHANGTTQTYEITLVEKPVS